MSPLTSTGQPTIAFDPDDLEAFYAAASRFAGRPRATTLGRIDRSADAALRLAEHVRAGGPVARVLVVQDETPMQRSDADLKPLIQDLLRSAGLSVTTVTLSAPGGVHADAANVAAVAEAIRPGDVVVSLGSGSITDITKHAAFT